MWTSSPSYAVRYTKHDPQKKKENHRSSKLVQLPKLYCSLKNEWYKSHLRLFYKWMNEHTHIYSLPLFGLRKGKDYYNNHSKFPSIYSPIFYSTAYYHNFITAATIEEQRINESLKLPSIWSSHSPVFSPQLLQFTMMVHCRQEVEGWQREILDQLRKSALISRTPKSLQNSIFGCKLRKITAYKVWSGLPWWLRW